MSYTTKNYMTDGGDTLVVGGKLVVDGGTVEGLVEAAQVVNNLTSTSTTSALSAKQGKELKTLVDARVKTADVINALNSEETTKPLSAAQGKELNTAIQGIDLKDAELVENIATVTSEGDDGAAALAGLNTLLEKLKAAGIMQPDAGGSGP